MLFVNIWRKKCLAGIVFGYGREGESIDIRDSLHINYEHIRATFDRCVNLGLRQKRR